MPAFKIYNFCDLFCLSEQILTFIFTLEFVILRSFLKEEFPSCLSFSLSHAESALGVGSIGLGLPLLLAAPLFS